MTGSNVTGFTNHTQTHITGIFSHIEFSNDPAAIDGHIHYTGKRCTIADGTEIHLHFALATLGVNFKSITFTPAKNLDNAASDMIVALCGEYEAKIPVYRENTKIYTEYNAICREIYDTSHRVCTCTYLTPGVEPPTIQDSIDTWPISVATIKHELPNMAAQLHDWYQQHPVAPPSPVEAASDNIGPADTISIAIAIASSNANAAANINAATTPHNNAAHKSGRKRIPIFQKTKDNESYYRTRHAMVMWCMTLLAPLDNKYIVVPPEPITDKRSKPGDLDSRLRRYFIRLCYWMFKHTNVREATNTTENPYKIKIESGVFSYNNTPLAQSAYAGLITDTRGIIDKPEYTYTLLFYYMYIRRAYKLLQRRAYIAHGDIQRTPGFSIYKLPDDVVHIAEACMRNPHVTCVLIMYTPIADVLASSFDIFVPGDQVSIQDSIAANGTDKRTRTMYTFFDSGLTAIAMRAYLKHTKSTNLYTYAMRRAFIEAFEYDPQPDIRSANGKLKAMRNVIAQATDQQGLLDLFCRDCTID